MWTLHVGAHLLNCSWRQKFGTKIDFLSIYYRKTTWRQRLHLRGKIHWYNKHRPQHSKSAVFFMSPTRGKNGWRMSALLGNYTLLDKWHVAGKPRCYCTQISSLSYTKIGKSWINSSSNMEQFPATFHFFSNSACCSDLFIMCSEKLRV